MSSDSADSEVSSQEDDQYDNYDDFDYDGQFDDEVDFDLTDDSCFDALAESYIDESDHTDLRDIRMAIDSLTLDARQRTGLFGDFIESHLERPSFMQTNAHSSSTLSLSLTTNQLTASPTEIPEDRLFITNVAPNSTQGQLRAFFRERGYDDLIAVNISYKSNRKTGIAFVDCRTEKSAQNILFDASCHPDRFVFNNFGLRIVLNEKAPPARKNPRPKQIIEDGSPAIINFPVQRKGNLPEILHGTLITPLAMRNLVASGEQQSDVGCIVQQLLKDVNGSFSASFEIDQHAKKIAFVLRTGSDAAVSSSDTDRSVRFEWHFRDLKGDRISPVHTGVDRSATSAVDSTLYMLVEVKRPPIIIHVEKLGDTLAQRPPRETRLPGTNYIGHANAWLFQLRPAPNDYFNLFRALRRYNLCHQPLSENNIVHFITPRQPVQRFRTLQLLSNDDWVRDHQHSVNKFLQHRWPRYPFEVKFELMKLLSKHIITVHDLIVDESRLDRLLARCSLRTFTACTDKIIGFASRWISTSDVNDEEEDDDDDTTKVEARSIPAPSTPITTTAAAAVSTKQSSSASSLGPLTRLLLLALNELKRHHEIVRTDESIYRTKHELRKEKADSFLIRKVYITPSSFLYEGPYNEEKCRVTRHYESDQDCFLRVAFRDEDYSKLRNGDIGMSKLYERIKMILKSGVVVCNRQYSFLAFSSSQLREHSCWMFHSRNARSATVDSIRSWMGDFKNIHPVAKYAARLGQSFSTTTKGSEVETTHFRIIADEETKDGQLFTDGIGIITKELASELAEKMKLQHVPSAFQIRCGGLKGMVCIDVASQIKEENVRAHFRDSMNKFGSHDHSIDIVRASHNASAFLNRQIILLLSSLGVDNHVFLSMQRRMLEKVLAVTKHATSAESLLREMNGEHGGNGTHYFMIEYLRRFGLRTDPLVRQMLLCFQAFHLKELRTKARIFVQNGCCLLGVVDESKTLDYGQVFVQIEQISDNNVERRILQGPVIVTRSPCFHPGDIRRLEAVDVPCLRDLKNVIVFPCRGSASHPNEMSGGDLDGDAYWISDDPQLLFARNEPPLDYRDQAVEAMKQAQKTERKKYSIEDVCDFFGEYIKADNLGFIANSHLAHADHLLHGARHETCIKLARMHSVAVDFAKNGVHAEALTAELRPKSYPHFMEKKDKTSYTSSSILGQLYNEVEYIKVDLHSEERQHIDQFPYSYFLVEGDMDYADEARSVRQEYNRELKRIMRQYGIRREGELLTGYILRFTSKQYTKQLKAFEVRNEIGHAIRLLRDKYIRYFWQEFYQAPDSSDDLWKVITRKLTWRNQVELADKHSRYSKEVEKKASAWYRAAYEQLVARLERRDAQAIASGDLFSFAWIAYPVLFRIADEGQLWSSLINRGNKKKGKRRRRRRRRRN